MLCPGVGCDHACQSHERQGNSPSNTAIIHRLIRHDAVCHAIADAYEADEVKQIREGSRDRDVRPPSAERGSRVVLWSMAARDGEGEGRATTRKSGVYPTNI